jgi:hypothetical protein
MDFVREFFKTLADMLAKVVDCNQKDWDIHLPFLLLAYRSSVQESTGYTPSKMMLGQEPILPADLLFGADKPETEAASPSNFIQQKRVIMNKIHEIARHNMSLASDRQKKQYDHRANSISYQIGDKVWLTKEVKTKGRTPKLENRWVGPFEIIDVLSDLNYKIKSKNKIQIVHHNRLKPVVNKM